MTLAASGEASLTRLRAAKALAEAVEQFADKRPDCGREDITELETFMQAATDAGVGPDALQAARAAHAVGVAELALSGVVVVCSNIQVTTHANDGDLQRLRKAFAMCEASGGDAELLADADHLVHRLEAEIHLGDALTTAEDALRGAYTAILEHASDDPTTLPWLPGFEPSSKSKKKRSGKNSARSTSRSGSPPQRSAASSGRGIGAGAGSRAGVRSRAGAGSATARRSNTPRRTPRPPSKSKTARAAANVSRARIGRHTTSPRGASRQATASTVPAPEVGVFGSFVCLCPTLLWLTTCLCCPSAEVSAPAGAHRPAGCAEDAVCTHRDAAGTRVDVSGRFGRATPSRRCGARKNRRAAPGTLPVDKGRRQPHRVF